ncbi:hypothetical protein NCER_102231 [Vairimorpha ceranae BRL01]|uniref:Uncharacterized protein n=2 Tax=Vairimorpha ceranae TaxID=40302 RepID=C4VBP0_VAIC1|nr:hypothetical protein AAJ76_870002930 [Vairimorpha ceranae]EEQ81361.1 hypothetical protein NCER_102231 [Vairimorpha ceranae BRL01]KAF5141032.1 hypothetical protein G9O61_00g008160 [Vairimorpha ceranae]KKO74290.1 hypothetical protein AAJ76_870002930 [Vairimorpha ceranae]
MALIITDNILDKIHIKQSTKIEPNTKYLLTSLDLDIIEYFYLKDKDLYIKNINIELILKSTSRFKFLEIKCEQSKNILNIKKYRNYVSKSFNVQDLERNIQISFYSDVYRSIYTSLLMPSAYGCKNNIYTEIFQFIAKTDGCTLKDIEVNVKGDVKKGINNLLFTEIIYKRNEVYKINDIFKV